MADPKDIKVLVVDDNVELCDLIATSFELFGFSVFKASTGEEALSMHQLLQVNIVITDYRMPNGDGLWLLEQLSKDKQAPSIYFITGYADEIPLDKIFELGARGLFEKPFDANEVRKAVSKSFLSKEDLWSKKVRSENKLFYKQFNELEDLYNAEDISLGEGGIFWAIDKDWPKLGQAIDFEIELTSQQPFSKIKGSGKVLWVRSISSPDTPQGFGFEIQWLSDQSIPIYLKIVSDLDLHAYIPAA